MKGGISMKRFFKILSLFLVLVFVLTAVMPASAAEVKPAKDADLTGYTVILHTNDTHGRAVPDSYNGYMGFSAVSALKKDYEAAGAKVLLLDAGDTLHGLPFATLDKGTTVARLMNLAGYDAMTPGNHDFNYGTDTLRKLANIMHFPLLSANITKKDSGENLFSRHTIIDKNGVKYGIFGLSTPETAYKTNPNNVSTIEFGNPVDAAQEEVTALKEAGADVIVALSHLGIDASSEFTSKLIAEKVEGIDLIVDGHSHSKFDSGLMIKDTLIVSTGDYFQNIGVVVIDKEGNMKAGLLNSSDYTGTDPDIDTVVKQQSDEQEKLLSEVVGHTSVTLNGVREDVRSKETNLGNLTTDAIRQATGADVAITNGGGIRASIEIGDITKKDLVTVFPFGNYVVTKYISGAALLEALEVGVSAYPELLGAFPQVSGITFSIDTSKPIGKRVVNAKVNGAAVDEKASYLFATNDFVIAGGDGYTMLADFEIVNEYGSLEEILLNYIKDLKNIDIKVDNRITAYNGVTLDEDKAETEKTTTKKVEKEIKKAVKNSDTYVVIKGDNLKKIALKLFGKESEWKKILGWNKGIILDPNKIYVGQILKLYAD